MFKGRKLMRILPVAGILCVLLSIYLAVFISSILGAGRTVKNPFEVGAWIAARGFPFFAFLVVFLLMAVIIGGVLYVFFGKLPVRKDALGRNFWTPSNRQSYGDAHFETPDEYSNTANIKTPVKALGPILGQLDQSKTKLLVKQTKTVLGNNNVLVIGPSGSGKSYTYTNNNIFQIARRRESVIISDPDGGLSREFAGYFTQKGYIVRIHSLMDPSHSHGWDALKSVRGPTKEKTVSNVQVFVNACLKNTGDGHAKEDIHFQGAFALFSALIMRVLFDDIQFKEEDKNIRKIIELLNMPFEGLEGLFDEATMAEEAKVCLGPWRTVMEASPNLRSNLIANLKGALNVLVTSPLLCDLLSSDDIDLELPGKQPCAYFCQFPAYEDTYKFMESLFFSMLMQNLVNEAYVERGKLQIPVNFLLDEFPALGVLPHWSSTISNVRKLHIYITMIMQSITQLQVLYPDEYPNIIGNCDTWVILGCNDEVTGEWLQERAGMTTVQSQTESHSPDESIVDVLGGSRRSIGEGKRYLIMMDEFMKMDDQDSFIFFARHNVVYANKFPYIYHPEYPLTLKEDPLGEIPDMSDILARKERKEKEQKYLDAFYAANPNINKHKEEVFEDTSDKIAVKEYSHILAESLRNATFRSKGKRPAKTHESEDRVEEEENSESEYVVLSPEPDDYEPVIIPVPEPPAPPKQEEPAAPEPVAARAPVTAAKEPPQAAKDQMNAGASGYEVTAGEMTDDDLDVIFDMSGMVPEPVAAQKTTFDAFPSMDDGPASAGDFAPPSNPNAPPPKRMTFDDIPF